MADQKLQPWQLIQINQDLGIIGSLSKKKPRNFNNKTTNQKKLNKGAVESEQTKK